MLYAKVYNLVLLIGKNDPITKETVDIAKACNNNIVIGDSNKGFALKDLEPLKNKINFETTIIIAAHGEFNEGFHFVNINGTMFETYKLLKQIQSYSSKPLNVVLESCYSGNIESEIKILKPGSLLTLTSPKDYQSLDLGKLIFKIYPQINNSSDIIFFENTLNNLPYFIAKEAKFLTRVDQLPLEITYRSILSNRKALNVINNHAEKYIQFVKNNFSLSLKKPYYNDSIIVEYQKILFVNECFYGKELFINFFQDNLELFKINRPLVDNDLIGQTPLYSATLNENIKLIKLLIKANADINKISPEIGITPVHIASEIGNMEELSLLIEAKANVNIASTKTGLAPLSVAVFKGNTDAVKLLIKTKADVNKASIEYNTTPLRTAINNKNYELAEILLKCGADPSIKSTNGISSYEKAIHNNDNAAFISMISKVISGELVYTWHDCLEVIDSGIKPSGSMHVHDEL